MASESLSPPSVRRRSTAAASWKGRRHPWGLRHGQTGSTAAWLASNPPPDEALGEHFALRFGLERPRWTVAPEHFLDRFWFKGDVPGFRGERARPITGGLPAAGIFIAAGALQRR